jgi:hypothetical protein
MVEKNLEMELYLFQNMRITSITSELEVGYEVAKSEFGRKKNCWRTWQVYILQIKSFIIL